MNYLDNDYLIPVILGNDKEAIAAARLVFDKTGIRPYIFSSEFSLEQRLLYRCKKVSAQSQLALILELCSFSQKHDAQGSPLLIYTDKNRQFVQDHSDDIESRYVTVSAQELLSFPEE